MSSPKLAVVGHPNKGKSSIVSTLVRQDAVAISELSGTTTKSQTFSMLVDGQELYQLVDTPGFQRPRQVLEILQQQTQDASQRIQAVRNFLSDYAQSEHHKFKDEVELLEPIINGAGIVYVVDGSVPYSPEYEAEMTILQWTGQPRMALINPIGGEHYVAQWQSALSQFFSVVRVFNPMTADAEKQRQILSAFAELHEPWREKLESARRLLTSHLDDLQRQAGQMIAEALQQMAQYQTACRWFRSRSIVPQSMVCVCSMNLRSAERKSSCNSMSVNFTRIISCSWKTTLWKLTTRICSIARAGICLGLIAPSWSAWLHRPVLLPVLQLMLVLAAVR